MVLETILKFDIGFFKFNFNDLKTAQGPMF